MRKHKCVNEKPPYVIVLWILSMCAFVCVLVCVCQFITFGLPCGLSLPSTILLAFHLFLGLIFHFVDYRVGAYKLLCTHTQMQQKNVWHNAPQQVFHQLNTIHSYIICVWVDGVTLYWTVYIVTILLLLLLMLLTRFHAKSPQLVLFLLLHTPKMWCILPTFFKFGTVWNDFHVRCVCVYIQIYTMMKKHRL